MMKNIILFGKPGAGKGTQAVLLRDAFQLVHISTGDLFRYNIGNNTSLGALAKSYMDQGDLVPDEVTIKMLEAEVDANPDAGGFIFDGFPRTAKQAEALDEFLHCKDMNVHATIGLEVDEEVLIKRLLNRGKDSGRADDQDEEKIRNRFEEYNNKTAPLINYYKAQNKFHSITGVGTVTEISEQLIALLDSL
tara:strand:- start:102 stop:677 length:576 start_codon:yes stop_codon:yes gene_type:complete